MGDHPPPPDWATSQALPRTLRAARSLQRPSTMASMTQGRTPSSRTWPRALHGLPLASQKGFGGVIPLGRRIQCKNEYSSKKNHLRVILLFHQPGELFALNCTSSSQPRSDVPPQRRRALAASPRHVARWPPTRGRKARRVATRRSSLPSGASPSAWHRRSDHL